VITEPPFHTGAVNVIVAAKFLGVATTAVGASGIVHGVADAEASDAAPWPTAFVALTVNV
jgi:hypothetical protein